MGADMIDFSQGFPAARELTLVESPGAFRFAENFMLAFHDPVTRRCLLGLSLGGVGRGVAKRPMASLSVAESSFEK